MRVNVKNYMYRWFDNMLILQSENDSVLYIYCPSECIYDDGTSRFYCYSTNIQEREFLDIDYVDYHIESKSDISCDGVAHFICYKNDKKLILPGYRGYKDRTLPNDILAKAGGYWHYRNDNEVVEKDRKKRQWLDCVTALADMIKKEN